MKKILFLIVILFSFLELSAQERDRDGHREKIKALKTAHITEGLNLTSEEAEKFWPIYNEYEQKKHRLYRKEHAKIENAECMNEDEASEKLEEFVALEKQDYLLKKAFYEDLRSILSPARIILLTVVEEEFNDKMMREYRKRH